MVRRSSNFFFMDGVFFQWGFCGVGFFFLRKAELNLHSELYPFYVPLSSVTLSPFALNATGPIFFVEVFGPWFLLVFVPSPLPSPCGYIFDVGLSFLSAPGPPGFFAPKN